MSVVVEADVVVVGSGTAAYCTAYDLAENRVNTLLISQSIQEDGKISESYQLIQIPHSVQKSLKQVTLQAIARWNVIQKAAKLPLIKSSPLVILGKDQDLLEKMAKNIRSLGQKPKWISIHQLDQQYGCHVPDDVLALENPVTTFINTKKSLQALHDLFVSVGGKLMSDWQIESITPGEPYINLFGTNGQIKAKNLILCPGPQQDELLHSLGVDSLRREVKMKREHSKHAAKLQTLSVVARTEADYKYICSNITQQFPTRLKVMQEANFHVDRHALFKNIIYSHAEPDDELLLAPVIGRAVSCLVRNDPFDHQVDYSKPLQSTL